VWEVPPDEISYKVHAYVVYVTSFLYLELLRIENRPQTALYVDANTLNDFQAKLTGVKNLGSFCVVDCANAGQHAKGTDLLVQNWTKLTGDVCADAFVTPAEQKLAESEIHPTQFPKEFTDAGLVKHLSSAAEGQVAVPSLDFLGKSVEGLHVEIKKQQSVPAVARLHNSASYNKLGLRVLTYAIGSIGFLAVLS
jgi:hypothetical protein